MARRLMLLLLALLLSTTSAQASLAQPVDLSADIAHSKVVKLSGPWNFHWKRFLQPDQIHDPATTTLLSNDSWSGQQEGTLEPFGFGSYVIQFSGLEPRENGYSIFVPSVIVAGRVIAFPEGDLDRKVETSVGFPGESAEATVPSLKSAQLFIVPKSRSEVWTIIIHAANFTKQTGGGLERPPEIAASEAFTSKIMKGSFVEASALGFILALAIYYIMIFLRQPADKSSLALVVSCVGAILQIFSKSIYVPIVFGFSGDTNYALSYAANYGSVPVSILGFYMFYVQAFPLRFNRIFTVFVWAVFAVLMLISVTFNVAVMNRFVILFQTMPMVIAIYGVILLFNAIRKRMEGARISALGFVFIFVSVVYDTGVSMNVFPYPSLFQYGVGCFLFMQGQVLAGRLAKAFKAADYLSKEKAREIRSIMQHIKQGIFAILPTGKIHDEFSRHLCQIVGNSEIPGTDPVALLSQASNLNEDDISRMKTAMHLSLNSPLEFELNESHLPREITLQGKDLEVDWQLIESEQGTTEKLLVTLRDVTEVKRLRVLAEHHEKELVKIAEILAVETGLCQRFFDTANRMLTEVKTLLEGDEESGEETLRFIFMRYHTIKGLVRSLGFKDLANVIHKAEHLCSFYQTQPGAIDKELLRNDMAQIRLMLDDYIGLFRDKLGRSSADVIGVRTEVIFKLLGIFKQLPPPIRRSLAQEETLFHQAYYKDLTSVLTDCSAQMAKVAVELDKLEPRLLVQSPQVDVPPSTVEILQNVLIHLFRNAIDHSLEKQDVRRAQGKSPQGLIEIKANMEKGKLVLLFEDDGQGLNLKKIREKAIELGKVDALCKDPQVIAQVIFLPGFSTASHVSEISGRGAGMDAVRTLIETHGGSIHLVLHSPHPSLLDSNSVRFHFKMELPETCWVPSLSLESSSA